MRQFYFCQLCECGHIDKEHGFGSCMEVEVPTSTMPNTVWLRAFRPLGLWSGRWIIVGPGGGPLDVNGELDEVISFYVRRGYREVGRSYDEGRRFWRRSRFMRVTLSKLPSSEEIARRSVTVIETREKTPRPRR